MRVSLEAVRELLLLAKVILGGMSHGETRALRLAVAMSSTLVATALYWTRKGLEAL